MKASIRLKFCSLLWTLKAKMPHSYVKYFKTNEQIFREWEYWCCQRSSLHDMCGEISCHMWAVGGQKWRLCFQTDLKMKPGRPHVLEDERVTDRHHKNRDSWSTEVNRLKGNQNLQISNIFTCSPMMLFFYKSTIENICSFYFQHISTNKNK